MSFVITKRAGTDLCFEINDDILLFTLSFYKTAVYSLMITF